MKNVTVTCVCVCAYFESQTKPAPFGFYTVAEKWFSKVAIYKTRKAQQQRSKLSAISRSHQRPCPLWATVATRLEQNELKPPVINQTHIISSTRHAPVMAFWLSCFYGDNRSSFLPLSLPPKIAQQLLVAACYSVIWLEAVNCYRGVKFWH